MDFPFILEAFQNILSKPSCNQYPFVPREAAPGYRGKIVFHPERCINCGMCERVCAGHAISTVSEPVEGGTQITRTFYLGSCTFCSSCADFCHEKAIEFTTDYHMVATKEEDLLVKGSFIKKAPVKKPAPPKAEAAPAAPKPSEEKTPEKKTSEEKTPEKKAPEEKAPEEKAAEEKQAEPAPAPAPIQPREDGKPTQDPSRCVYCTLCAKKCPAEALEVDRAAKTWKLDEEKCLACGTCAEACPKNAIVM